MKYDLSLNPVHYASISGGKDSLYMFLYILTHLDKYPLDMVVHFELEIDWPWAKQVVDYMEEKCKQLGIKFVRISPRKTWNELYEKYDVPTRRCRWCNSDYKLDCKKQLNQWIFEQNCRPIAYIGFCADETKRFKYKIGEWKTQDICYPLAEEGITENVILSWAKKQQIFNGWYKIFKRQGCMICPCLTRLEMAYLCKYYEEYYRNWINLIKKYEYTFETTFYSNKSIIEIDLSVRTKYMRVLDNMETYEQLTIFDFM